MTACSKKKEIVGGGELPLLKEEMENFVANKSSVE